MPISKTYRITLDVTVTIADMPAMQPGEGSDLGRQRRLLELLRTRPVATNAILRSEGMSVLEGSAASRSPWLPVAGDVYDMLEAAARALPDHPFADAIERDAFAEACQDITIGVEVVGGSVAEVPSTSHAIVSTMTHDE